MTDLETRLRQTMNIVAESTRIPPVPQPEAMRVRRGRRIRRRMAALIAAGGLGVIGVGAAAADGAFSPGAKQAFGDWQNINPRDAFLVAELPGPAGTVVAAYEASDRSKNQTCVAFVVRNDPAYDGSVGGACWPAGSPDGPFPVGGSVSEIEVPGHGELAVFAMSAPGAANAELDYRGGAHPVAIANGLAVGWVPESAWTTATLIARDADGVKVLEIRGIGTNQPEFVTSTPALP